MRLGQRTYLSILIVISVLPFSLAQVSKDAGLFINVKSHKFYDSGVYEVAKHNSATGFGVGLGVVKPINKRLALNAGYSFALADRLPYKTNYTSNAIFHQLEANLDLKLFKIWKLQTAVFTGYAYNWIQQIDDFGYSNSGMNINLGASAEARITPYISLAYRLTYGFSISENIPYNFKNQLGVILYAGKQNKEPKDKTASFLEPNIEPTKPSIKQSALAAENETLRVITDSLKNELQKRPITLAIEDKSVFVTYNNELLERIKYLEEDNQLLLDELRSKRHFTDSIYSTNYNGYTLIDSLGHILSLDVDALPSGYYIHRGGIETLAEVLALSKRSPFVKLEKTYYLNRNLRFNVLSFVSSDRDMALEYFKNLGDQRFFYNIIKL